MSEKMFGAPSLCAGIVAAFLAAWTPSLAVAQSNPSFEARYADLIKAAKAEGSVTWYLGIQELGGSSFARHFQDRFGIRVNAQHMPSGPIFERFRSESAAGQNIADVFSSGDAVLTLAVIKAGYLLKYDTGTKALFPNGWVYDFPNGTAYPVQRVQMGILYNTRLVKADELKGLTTWKGLLDPALANGRLALGDPTRSLTAFSLYLYWLRANEAEYGKAFVEKLIAQKPVIYSSHTLEGARIAAGETPVGVIVDDIAINQYNLGAPVAILYPSPTPVILQHTGISRNAPHPNAAKLFLEYFTSEEGLAEWKKASGTLTGMPSVDAKYPLKYTSEPWYRAPSELFFAGDGRLDLENEFREFSPVWKALVSNLTPAK